MDTTKRRRHKYCLNIAESVFKIIGAVAVPLIIAIIGLFIQRDVANISHQTDWQKHDLSVLQEFQKTYPNENTRGLSLRYLKLIKDDKTQTETRIFVLWDLLRQIVKTDSNLGGKFKFDKNSDNVYYLAENFIEMYEMPDKKLPINILIGLISNKDETYKDYSSRKQFYLLLNCIVERSNLGPKLPKDSLQKLQQEVSKP